MLFYRLQIFFNINFFEKKFRITIWVSNRLDPDQARHFVGPDLGPICLERVWSEDASRQWVNWSFYEQQLPMLSYKPIDWISPNFTGMIHGLSIFKVSSMQDSDCHGNGKENNLAKNYLLIYKYFAADDAFKNFIASLTNQIRLDITYESSVCRWFTWNFKPYFPA